MVLNHNIKKNHICFFIYVLILLFSFFVNNFYVSIISSLMIYVIIFVTSINYSIGIVFSLLSLSGIYDSSGFLYVFNLSIIVLVIKLIVMAVLQKKISKDIIKCLAIVSVLFAYELLNATFNDILSVSYISNISIWFGYVLLIFISCFSDSLDKKKIFLISYFGFILSCFLCFIQIYMKWGFDIPSVYRFVGLLRDPNYFSFMAILLLFSSFYVLEKKYKYLVGTSVFILGMLSVSKMYFVLCIAGVIIYIVYYFYLLSVGKIYDPKRFIYFAFALALFSVILYYFGLFDLIMDKYVYRFEEYGLMTGRDYIQGTFLKILSNDSYTMLFGKTLDYNKVFKVAYAASDAMVAHNTYLDLIMSFGFFGTLIYIGMILSIIKLYKNDVEISGKKIIVVILFALTLFALSYLKADNFTICILFVLISMKKNNSQEVIVYEKNNYVSSNA